MSRSIRNLRRAAFIISALILAIGVTGPTAQAGFTWTGAVSSDWFTPGNWSPAGVPGATDTGTINSGTVDVPADATIAALDFGGGTITGTGTLTVTGRMNWTGGNMVGSGATVIGQGATLNLVGSGSRTLVGRQIDNRGTINIAGGGFCGGNFSLDNAGVIDFGAGGGFTVCNGGAGTIHNTGTLRKSAGADVTSLTHALNNNGVLDVQTGTIQLASQVSDTSAGAFIVAAGATLQFGPSGGTHTLTGTSSLAGAGSVAFTEGTVNVGGIYDVAGTTSIRSGTATFNTASAINALDLGSGTLGGSGTLSLTGAASWTGGNMVGSGATIVAQGVTLSVVGSASKTLVGRQLDNRGTINIAGGGFCGGLFMLNNAGMIDFGAGGSFTVCNGGAGTIHNTGTLKKSAGADVTSLTHALNNDGVLDIQTGTVQLASQLSGTSAGAFIVAAGATLQFGPSGGTYTLTGTSSVAGAGNLAFTEGTVTLGGIYDVAGTTSIRSGTATFNTAAAIASLDLGSGNLAGSGTLTLTGAASWTGGNMVGSGATVVGQGATLNLAGSGSRTLVGRQVDNRGTINIAAAFCGGNFMLNNPGIIDFGAGGSFTVCNGGAGTIHNTGTLRKSAGPDVSALGHTLNNSGTVEALSGTLNLIGIVNQTAGIIRLNGGAISVNGPTTTLIINGGALVGTGTIEGNVVNSSTVSPGLANDAAGALQITGNYTQTASGRLEIDLGGRSPGSQFDQLILGTDALTKTATLGGTLDLQLANGFQPAANDSFELVRFSSLITQFSSVNGTDIGNGQTFTPDYRPNNLVLIAGAVDGGTATGCGSPARIWVQIVAPRTARLHNFVGGPLYESTVLYGNSGGTGALAFVTTSLKNLKPEYVVTTTGVSTSQSLATVLTDLDTGERLVPVLVFIPPDNPACLDTDSTGTDGTGGGGGGGGASGGGANGGNTETSGGRFSVVVSAGGGGGGGTGGGGTGGGGTGGGGTGGGGTGGGGGCDDGSGVGGAACSGPPPGSGGSGGGAGGGGAGGGAGGGGNGGGPNTPACDPDFISENDVRATQVDTSQIGACMKSLPGSFKDALLNTLVDQLLGSLKSKIPHFDDLERLQACYAAFAAAHAGARTNSAQAIASAAQQLLSCAGVESVPTPVIFELAFNIAKQFVEELKDGPCGARNKTKFVFSCDPNDKVGPSGVGAAQFISGDVPIPYAVFYENKPEASVPAQDVVITDQLDISRFDLSTFQLGAISFGDKTVVPPSGRSEFNTQVDLRPATDLLVRINAGLDKTTGLATWRFASIDTKTLQPTFDPLAGFLPPNRLPAEGQGSVLFSVSPKAGMASGTPISNGARIFFDSNAPIDTPVWLNTIDHARPSSRVQPLAAPSSAGDVAVHWSGTDADSGIANFSLFVSEDGGPFAPWLRNTTDASAIYPGRPGKSYGFFSVARDNTGNLENAKTVADAVTPVNTDRSSPITIATLSSSPNAAGWHNADVTVAFNATDEGSGVSAMFHTVTRAQATTGETTSGASLSISITAEGTSTITFYARDNAGNAEAMHTVTVRLDKTAPTINASRTPAANANGWNNTNVTASYTASDRLSGLDANSPAAGSYTFTAEGAGQSHTFTATDLAGNAGSATVGDVSIDKTKPTIAAHGNESAVATGSSGTVVSYTSPATHDAVDGDGTASCSPASGSLFAIGTTTVICSAIDATGNHAAGTTFTVTVTVTTTPGDMSGDGFVRDDDARYQFSFRAAENDSVERAQLSVRIDDDGRKKKDKKGSSRPRDDRFESRTVTFLAFSDDPTIRQGKPRLPQVDTVLFKGVGEWNGQGGYRYEAFAQDQLDPKASESIRVTIWSPAGTAVASFDGELDGGTIRSKRIKH